MRRLVCEIYLVSRCFAKSSVNRFFVVRVKQRSRARQNGKDLETLVSFGCRSKTDLCQTIMWCGRGLGEEGDQSDHGVILDTLGVKTVNEK
jgi:hypothetical protein